MIGNITRGSDFAGLGRYLYATGKNHEAHVDPRAVASENVLRDDSRGWRPWVADMQWCAQQRPDVAKPVWHCSLRAAPEDRLLSDEQWGRIAAEHVEKMGLAEHPWVAVRHGEDHIHIVASRVNGDGKLWRDSFDKERNKASMRELEERHGLTRLVDERATSRLAAVTKSEREKGKRLRRDPERAQLRDRMHEARDAARGRGLGAWHRQLEDRGVMFRPATTKDGRVTGYSVSREGWTDARGEQVWVKASQVDRGLSWSKLRTDLGADRPGADRVPKTAAELAREAFPHSTTEAVRASKAEIDNAARLARGRPSAEQARPATAAQRADEVLARVRARQQQQRDQERGRGR